MTIDDPKEFAQALLAGAVLFTLWLAVIYAALI